jgi:hypothetical protein
MNVHKRFTLLVAGTLFATGLAVGQHQNAQMGMMMHNYDPAKETTFQGTVESVQQGRGMMMGVLARVKVSPDRTESVFIGPAWFLEEKKFTVAKGDEITVTGAVVEHHGAIVARVVQKGEVSLALRDVRGMPMWAGHHR